MVAALWLERGQVMAQDEISQLRVGNPRDIGHAAVWLDPGEYRYRFSGGGGGTPSFTGSIFFFASIVLKAARSAFASATPSMACTGWTSRSVEAMNASRTRATACRMASPMPASRWWARDW